MGQAPGHRGAGRLVGILHRANPIQRLYERRSMKKHFVTFYSPGTLFSESSSKPIEDWNVKEAVLLSKNVEERHGAKPYGFVFTTDVCHEPVPDGEGRMLEVKSREIERSGVYFLTGKVIRYDEVPDTKEFAIMRSNMECNDFAFVVENINSYRSTMPFGEKDAIVDWDGEIVERGNDSKRMKYREKFQKLMKKKKSETSRV